MNRSTPKTAKQKRHERLLPVMDGIEVPRYVRCYDNGGASLDNFTVVFTGHYRQKTDGEIQYITMNARPFHPQGIGQHGASLTEIDRPAYGHLGKKIAFKALPADCQQVVLQDYREIWDLK